MKHVVLLCGALLAISACSRSPVDKDDNNTVIVITNNETTGTNNQNNDNNTVTECGPGRELCAGTCVDTSVDSDNCQTCGTVCPDNTVCSNGTCAEVPTDCRVEGECPARYFCDQVTGICDVGCASNADCPADSYCELESNSCLCTDANQVVCGSVCADEGPLSCGPDCETCPPVANGSTTCIDGTCGQVCDDGFMMCDGQCSACPAGAGVVDFACLDGQCVANQCEGGYEVCDGVCASCPATTGDESLGCDGQTCVITDCPAGTRLCGGSCADCPEDPNGSNACQGTECVLTCSSGFHSCGGYCASDTDVNNCGTACETCTDDPNGTPLCTGGSCELQCDNDYRFCSGGCSACPSGPGVVSTRCSGSTCVAQTCAAGWEPCAGGCCQDAPDGVAYDWSFPINSVSTAVDSRGYPHIAFGSASANEIRYVYWDGSSWQDEFVTTGWHVDIELDLMDRPHIAVWKRNPDGAWYAMRDPVNGWSLEEVDNTFNDVGMTPDLELLGNTPHIAYFDLEQDNLRYAVKSGGTWNDQAILTAGEVGFSPDMVLTNGEIHIVCREEIDDALIHVSDTGNGFIATTLDNQRNSGNHSSMVADDDGELHLVYVVQNATSKSLLYQDKELGQPWGVEGFTASGDKPSVTVNDISQYTVVYYEDRGLYYDHFPSIDSEPLDVATDFQGEFNDSKRDPATDRVHVAYSDGQNDDIKYLSFVP